MWRNSSVVIGCRELFCCCRCTEAPKFVSYEHISIFVTVQSVCLHSSSGVVVRVYRVGYVSTAAVCFSPTLLSDRATELCLTYLNHVPYYSQFACHVKPVGCTDVCLCTSALHHNVSAWARMLCAHG